MGNHERCVEDSQIATYEIEMIDQGAPRKTERENERDVPKDELARNRVQIRKCRSTLDIQIQLFLTSAKKIKMHCVESQI